MREHDLWWTRLGGWRSRRWLTRSELKQEINDLKRINARERKVNEELGWRLWSIAKMSNPDWKVKLDREKSGADVVTLDLREEK